MNKAYLPNIIEFFEAEWSKQREHLIWVDSSGYRIETVEERRGRRPWNFSSDE